MSARVAEHRDNPAKSRRKIDPAVATQRARLANATRRGDTDAADDARRALRAAQLEEHITRVVDAAPPLTDEQREHLAGLLRPGAVATGA